eukprot:bmy_21159T0
MVHKCLDSRLPGGCKQELGHFQEGHAMPVGFSRTQFIRPTQKSSISELETFTMSGAPDVLKIKGEYVLKFLAAGTHLGGTNLEMEQNSDEIEKEEQVPAENVKEEGPRRNFRGNGLLQLLRLLLLNPEVQTGLKGCSFPSANPAVHY